MTKDNTTKNVRKARKMAGKKLSTEQILEALDRDSSSDDSSDEEGDDRPERLVHPTDGLFAPGQEDVPVLVDDYDDVQNDVQNNVQNDVQNDVQNLQDALDEEPRPNGRPDRSRNIKSFEDAKNREHYNLINNPRNVLEYPVKVKPSRGVVGPSFDITWTNQIQNRAGRPRACELIQGPVCEVHDSAKNAKKELQCWELYMSEDILNKIIKHTNENIQEAIDALRITQQTSKNTHFYLTDNVEIKALFGLMYFRGLEGKSGHKSSRLWQKGVGHPVFGAVMSRSRFKFLLGRLRFENHIVKNRNWRNDRFAAFRAVHEIFVENCSRYLWPSSNGCIDETLVPMRNRSAMRYYIKTKPARYGMQWRSYCEVLFPYTYSSVVMAGKPVAEVGPFYINNVIGTLKKIVENIERHVTLEGRTISTDRLYTSIPAAKWLIEKNITLGTIKINVQYSFNFLSLDFAATLPRLCCDFDSTLL